MYSITMDGRANETAVDRQTEREGKGIGIKPISNKQRTFNILGVINMVSLSDYTQLCGLKANR